MGKASKEAAWICSSHLYDLAPGCLSPIARIVIQDDFHAPMESVIAVLCMVPWYLNTQWEFAFFEPLNCLLSTWDITILSNVAPNSCIIFSVPRHHLQATALLCILFVSGHVTTMSQVLSNRVFFIVPSTHIDIWCLSHLQLLAHLVTVPIWPPWGLCLFINHSLFFINECMLSATP